MEVLRSSLLLILLVASSQAFSILRGLIADAPSLSEITDDFALGVGSAAGALTQAAVHKARATGGAVTTVANLKADLLRNFLANNYYFWSTLGNGVSNKTSQMWNSVFGGSGNSSGASALPGSGASLTLGSGTWSLPALGGSSLPASGASVMPGSAPPSIVTFPSSMSPSSKLERLRNKFAARPGCSLWESVKLPSSRSSETIEERSNNDVISL